MKRYHKEQEVIVHVKLRRYNVIQKIKIWIGFLNVQFCKELSLLSPTLFLLYINYLPKNILKSLVKIYVNNTTVYECTSKNLNDQSQDELLADFALTTQWEEDWHHSISPNTKLVMFCHHWGDPKFTPVLINGCTPNEAPCIKHLLGLKLTPDLKWNLYIHIITKGSWKMVGSFYRSRKYMTF